MHDVCRFVENFFSLFVVKFILFNINQFKKTPPPFTSITYTRTLLVRPQLGIYTGILLHARASHDLGASVFSACKLGPVNVLFIGKSANALFMCVKSIGWGPLKVDVPVQKVSSGSGRAGRLRFMG